mgnify:CR=1 FL=1
MWQWKNVMNDTSLDILCAFSAVNYVKVQWIKFSVGKSASDFSILLCMWDCMCGFPDSDREKSSRKKFSSHSLVWNWLCDFKGLSSISFLSLFCIIILSPITICLLYHHFHQYFFYFWRMFLKGNISLWLLLLSEFDIQNHENLKMTVLQLC